MTDTERLDWLQRQQGTRWVTYTTQGGHAAFPVFAGDDLRGAIDRGILAQARAAEYEAVKP